MFNVIKPYLPMPYVRSWYGLIPISIFLFFIIYPCIQILFPAIASEPSKAIILLLIFLIISYFLNPYVIETFNSEEVKYIRNEIAFYCISCIYSNRNIDIKPSLFCHEGQSSRYDSQDLVFLQAMKIYIF